jgi:glycosyltransferase involved in cell wall biosynthesis
MISIVVPMMNEEAGLPAFLDTLIPICREIGPFEIIAVNDGSSDTTLDILMQYQKHHPELAIVDFSRNFGKEAALIAGLNFCSGFVAITMDADLQHPPECIPEMLAKWHEGYEIVSAVREDRQVETFVKRLTANYFYKIFNKISEVKILPGEGDFRLLDRKAIDALLQLPERARFNKGLFNWIGFKLCHIHHPLRERNAGETKWDYRKLFRFAIDGFISFSNLPLKIWTHIGLTCSFIAIAYAVYVFVRTLIFGADVPGYPSIIIAVFFMGGLILSGIGILGEYISRVFEETKQRPLYIVRNFLKSKSQEKTQ